jgi:hypothetical protein
MWKYLTLSLLLLTCTQIRANDTLPHATLGLLRSELATQVPTYSHPFLGHLAATTDLPDTTLRARLLELLETLDQQRKAKSETWESLTHLGGEAIPAGNADRLLRNLIKEARVALEGAENYLLDNGVRQATKKARLSDFQGRAYLLQALDWALTGSVEAKETADFGVLVGGHTRRFEINKDPLFIFFDSEDEAFVLEQVREIQRFIVPALTRRLPYSPHIRWAVRQREANALLDPRYKILFGVENLTFTGSNRDLRPCIESTIELLAMPDETVLHTQAFQHCSEKHGSASAHTLNPFYEEIADEASQLLEVILGRYSAQGSGESK